MVNLESKAAPAGVFPVVLSAGWSGVLIHEAVGHGLEGDTCRKGESVYSKLIGEQVASELCTIVDDGTIARARGSLSIDDEGEPSRYNVLIENGKLKSFMYDKHSAHLAGKVSTGNGRRDSYSSTPQTRMTNTYMLPGTSEEAEMIESVKKGIYAVSLGGGQVDVTSGKFVFSVNEAYEINNGKVGHPLKGITLIGDAIGVMKKVSMVGNNLKFDGGVGTCGKGGQWVPVGIGIPSVKVDEITIGGTK
jgi:TldD protein